MGRERERERNNLASYSYCGLERANNLVNNGKIPKELSLRQKITHW